MATEIERKFLVRDMSFMSLATSATELAQGYLSTDADATVRVRTCGDRAWLTVKSRNHGATRDEWEYPVPVEDALQMLERCCADRKIVKTRYIVDAGDGLCWEIDVFHGRHEGLIVAEIELPAADTAFSRPDFIGREVTGDPAYYNSVLCKA
ncbi:MAG: CYTH domain-containing protein [Muribaculaceae bacterium]|nr:CYTH domain-containing protein [Muribaculaceae bacterium]